MRIRTWSGLATLAVIGVMATSAFAQQPGGQQGGRGRGSFGGGFGPPSALSISVNAAVQKDAGISEEQAGKLKTLNDEAQAAIRESMGTFGSFRDLSEEERRTKMDEMNAKRTEITGKFKAKLSDILDAKQVERIDQITLQAAATQAYSDPAVVKTLKLTKEQQDKIAEINKEVGDKRRELFGGAGGGAGGDARAKMTELSAAQAKDLEAVLTADQKGQLAKMKGKEFDVAQLRQGFGGAPGGRRPGGGGDGQTRGGTRPRRPE